MRGTFVVAQCKIVKNAYVPASVGGVAKPVAAAVFK
jgi:hypothetical protein